MSPVAILGNFPNPGDLSAYSNESAHNSSVESGQSASTVPRICITSYRHVQRRRMTKTVRPGITCTTDSSFVILKFDTTGTTRLKKSVQPLQFEPNWNN